MEAVLSSEAAPRAASRRCLIASEVHTNSLPDGFRRGPSLCPWKMGKAREEDQGAGPRRGLHFTCFPSDSTLMISHTVTGGQRARWAKFQTLIKGTKSPCRMELRANWPQGVGVLFFTPKPTLFSRLWCLCAPIKPHPNQSLGNLSALQVTTPGKSLQNGLSSLWIFQPGPQAHAWNLLPSKHTSLQPVCYCPRSLYQPHTPFTQTVPSAF